MDAFLDKLSSNAFENLDVSGHQVDLQGWMCGSFENVFRDVCIPRLKQAAIEGITRPLIIEVGTWKGLSTNTMARLCKEVMATNVPRLLAIDTWLGAPEFWTPHGLVDRERGGSFNFVHGYPSIFYTFTKNVKTLGNHDLISPFPISSGQAPEVLKHYQCKADIIYVDASHEYDAVMADLRAYWPILSEGGVMFGDDYMGNWPGVVRAVNEFAAEQGLDVKINGVVWHLIK